MELQNQHKQATHRKAIDAIIARAGWIEAILDRVPDMVFFVKDLDGRYRLVNSTLVERCGVRSKSELVGRTATEVFPNPLGARYTEQDHAVCASGMPLTRRLELHLYPNGREGWCLTDKLPLLGDDGRTVGLVGLSRDVQPSDGVGGGDTREIERVVERIRAGRDDPPTVDQLAREAGMSAYQLNRRLRRLLGITARQLLVAARVDAASRLLRTTDLVIGEVAQRSGYCDQSAFTRQFRRSTGLTPMQYRHRHRTRSVTKGSDREGLET